MLLIHKITGQIYEFRFRGVNGEIHAGTYSPVSWVFVSNFDAPERSLTQEMLQEFELLGSL